MQILSRIFERSSWQFYIVIIFFLGNVILCTRPTNIWYFKEGGSLLWVNEKHKDQAIKNAVKHTLENSSIIVAQVPWSPKDSSFFNNTAWYFSLAKDHGKSFMINIDWQVSDRSGTNGDWSFEDPKIANLYKKDMVRLVKTYNPNYINLGVEANYYALNSVDGFRAFVKVFRELKDDLNELNPKLKIGLSYQLELLYGCHKDWNEIETLATLDVIHGDIDFLGISTYPNMAINGQENVLSSINYLDSLVQRYSIPMGISETAVSSSLYDDSQRADYINAIFKKANYLDLKFVIWGSMIDSPHINTNLDNFGLLDVRGNPKKEFEIWESKNQKLFK